MRQLCGLLLFALIAGSAAALPTLDEIDARLRSQQERIASWSALMRVDIDLPGMRVKGKKVELQYLWPDSFSFKAKGFALLPRRTMMWTADSLFRGLSEVRIEAVDDSLQGSPLLVQGLFREGGLFARMAYRVDTLRWLVTHVSTSVITQSDTLEALSLRNQYLQAEEGIWLPQAVDVSMKLRDDLQQFYERLRTPLRRRSTSRDGEGEIHLRLEDHAWTRVTQEDGTE